MATQSNNFTRSNVNAATLQITDPGRSSFNLGHKNELTIPFGKIVPVSTKILLPTDTFSGSLKPNFHLEKIGTPSIGATRLDTHTFVVNFRRINRDMRSNLENGTNFFPSFNPYVTLSYNLGFLLGKKDVDVYLKSLFAESSNTLKSISIRIFTNAITNLKVIRNGYNDYGEHCYQLDKYIFLIDYYTSVKNDIENLTLDAADPRYLFKYALPLFFKPFIGNGSLFDYLGYPCYTQYNQLVAVLDSLPSSAWADIRTEIKSTLDANKPFIVPVLANAISINQSTYKFMFYALNSQFSELPLRAYYSVWYDYLRNWHIEERKNILDPDNFNNAGIVPEVRGSITADTVHRFSEFLSLCTLRCRDYGTDFLTSIQTDDAFRHVYSPVFSMDSTGIAYSGSTTLKAGDNGPDTVNGLDIQDFGLFGFPSDKSDSQTPTTFSFAQDLQTMRRAGLLERWLARNYYYPDTYVGRLQARFGVRPSDYEILVSQYIGGSESFISGQELVANMSTSESVVGSRNLKADVSTTDNFSGSVSDYSILISVVSTVPIVTYDVLSPAASITDFIDYPQPEFATDTRVEARVSDFLRGFSVQPFIGYVPRYYLFRVSADETHGRYLTDYRTYNWLRDNYSMGQEDFDFSLNPYSLRVNLPLNAFIGLKPWDDFAYGSCDVNLVVNRALPAAIEII